MVGNRRDAALALYNKVSGRFEYLYSQEGSTRYVFLINGVIYKVNNGDWFNADTNAHEFEQATSLRSNLPAEIEIPEMSLYDINGEKVLAAVLIEGQSTGECFDLSLGLECDCNDTCMPEELIYELERLGWTDASYGNAILKGGIYYLVDVA